MPSSSSTPTRSADPPGRARPQPVTSSFRQRVSWARLPAIVRRMILLVLLIAVWETSIRVMDVNPLLFAKPSDVAGALWGGLVGGELVRATRVTLQILVTGMAIGMAIATVFVIFATWSKVGDDLLTLLTSMINPLPAIAILPLALLWFGLSATALIFVIANAVLWPIAINVSMGFRTVPATIMMVGRNIGLRGWKLVRDVLMPAALPHTISGVKTGWAFGWRTIIAAELVFGVAGGGGGLGYFINDSRYFLRIPDVFAGLVLIAAIGVALEYLFNFAERRTVIRWGMKSA